MSIRFGLTIATLLAGQFVVEPSLLGQDKFPNPFGVPLSFGSKVDADVDVSSVLISLDDQTAELRVSVTLPQGYYIYSMNPAFSGKSSIRLLDTGSLQPASGQWQADRPPKVVFESLFGQDVEKFFDQVTWSQQLRTTGSQVSPGMSVTGELSGQFCSSEDSDGGGACIPLEPPRRFTAVLREDGGTFESPRGSAASIIPASVHPLRSPVRITPEIGFADNRQPAPIRYAISLIPENPEPNDEVTLRIDAEIDRPWHTFALDQDPEMAGLPTVITLTSLHGLQAKTADLSFTVSVEPEIEEPLAGFVQRVHYDQITWAASLRATGGMAVVKGTIAYQLCNAGSCTNPAEVEFAVATGVDLSMLSATGDLSGTGDLTAGRREPAAPVKVPDEADAEARRIAKDGLLAFILTALGAGFVALLTPCVFPMVPVTVAFFLKQSEKKGGSTLGLATMYCLGIVGAFTILGMLVSMAFGPTKLNELANNRWLNLVFAALFLLFGLMLMGMFELRMPSWLLTWSSKRESTGGIVGALFMALTFTLVSFTCTFAFVGTLLVLAATGDRLWPVIGMLAFSTAFASPFFLLALFPSMLKKLPRSGGWMNTVKVTMGLIELGFVLKFLSVADIGFSPDRLPFLLDTQSFLVGWMVIGMVTGLYLLNVFRLNHDTPVDGISALRCLFAMTFLSFAAYIGTGVFSESPPTGWVWQQVQAFAPPEKTDHLKDFRVAIKLASSQQKLLFVDFTGVNCINCRRMEQTVLVEPRIHDRLAGLVQVQLYTDEVPGIRNKALRDELLALNRRLQQELVQETTLPVYAVVTPDGQHVITKFSGMDRSGGEDFLKFLNTGIALWKKQQEQSVTVTSRNTRHEN